MSIRPNEHEIRSSYDQFAISEPDKCPVLHEANNLNLQSEIFSSLRPSFRAHDSSSRVSCVAGPRHFLIRLAGTQLLSLGDTLKDRSEENITR